MRLYGKLSCFDCFEDLVSNKRVHWVQVVPEPVEMWQNIGGFNTLDLLYKDARRWSLTFQSYVQLTMLQNHTRRQVPLSPSL